MITFTKHAKDKFGILKKYKFSVSEEQVLATVAMPDLTDYSRAPLLIAQRKIDKNHVLRVVYRQERGSVKIITFYPGKSKQYKNENKR
ncbi:MAG: hypothetical protein HZB10_01015 [Candidatus Yonathbacteria bacterium]|nr:hypothetical protein [Candidatus Yonathbacteria bacterium]